MDIPNKSAEAYKQWLEDGVTDYNIVVREEVRKALESIKQKAKEKTLAIFPTYSY